MGYDCHREIYRWLLLLLEKMDCCLLGYDAVEMIE